MIKFEPIKSVTRSFSSSSLSSSSSSDDDNDSDDRKSISSSNSCLSLIETSRINSLKSCQKRPIPTSVHLIPQGTILNDIHQNQWIIHQYLKISKENERFLYLCSQMKRSSTINEKKLAEEMIVKIQISSLMYLTEKLKQSRELIMKKTLSENEKFDYIFYGAILGDTNKEIQLIFPTNHTEKQLISTNNKYLSSTINNSHTNKILYGIIEFFKDDDKQTNKYSIEIYFLQKSFNSISNPTKLIEQILNKEIEKLKELRKKTRQINNDSHQFLIKQKSETSEYDIQETLQYDEDQFSSVKYLLKLEFISSTSSKTFTIDDEISFYSRFATHEKLKSYIKRHNLMYIAIPEYISHGIYKHLNSTYKFLIMEQYRENLRSLISSYDQSLPEHNALNLFLQMLYVLQFLHEKNYVHQIIKPKYLMFANKQPYLIFLTQFRTVKNINESNEVPQENQHIKQEKFPIKKKIKHSHRTQLASIHNKTSSIVPSSLAIIDLPSPMIEDENLLLNAPNYHHPFSVYASLDLHLNNKQTYRGDLEMLGYNLIVWSGGRLPWDKTNPHIQLKFHHSTVTNEKKLAKSNVNEFVKKCFFMKLISPVTLRAICDYMSTIYQLNIDDLPNFDQLRAPIKEIVKALGFKANACLRLSNSKSKTSNPSNSMNNSQIVKTNANSNKQIQSPGKEFEVEHDDLDDEDDDDDDDDDEEEDDDDEDDKEEEEDCLRKDNDEENSSNETDDTQMEQQAPNNPGQTQNSKCTRCGGDHSLEDQQSQTSSDKQSSNTNQLNTLTYQQKRQRSIAKRLQLRRKNKN